MGFVVRCNDPIMLARSSGSVLQPVIMFNAFLYALLEDARALTEDRRRAWNRYHDVFARLERNGKLRRPIVTPECEHAYLYQLLLPDLSGRTR
jgi:dTDP-4-amino-4,6-dideoxygalactose transaminase